MKATKYLLAAGVAGLLATGAAQAQPFDWSGVYVGLTGGYGWGPTTWKQTGFIFPTGGDFSIGNAQTWGASGFLAGAVAGYNLQDGPWVGGFELSAMWSNIAGGATSIYGIMDDEMYTELNLLVSGVARVGYSFGGTLIYIAGGLSSGAATVYRNDTNPPTIDSWGPYTAIVTGLTVGGGISQSFGNMYVGVDYRYHDLFAHDFAGATSGGGVDIWDHRIGVHQVTATVGVML